MQTTGTYKPSRGDRVSIVAFLVAGAAIIAWSIFATVMRVREVLAGTNVPVEASFIDLDAQAPIGPNGTMVPVQIDSAIVTVPHLTQPGLGAAILAPLVFAITVSVVVTCLIVLGRNALYGRIFSAGNTRLVATAGVTALVGFGIVPAVEGAVAASAIEELSDGTFHGFALLVAEPMLFVLLAFAFAIVITAYAVGARMQRDQEGLV